MDLDFKYTAEFILKHVLQFQDEVKQEMTGLIDLQIGKKKQLNYIVQELQLMYEVLYGIKDYHSIEPKLFEKPENISLDSQGGEPGYSLFIHCSLYRHRYIKEFIHVKRQLRGEGTADIENHILKAEMASVYILNRLSSDMSWYLEYLDIQKRK